jgi:hypothetical protein
MSSLAPRSTNIVTTVCPFTVQAQCKGVLPPVLYVHSIPASNKYVATLDYCKAQQ